MESVWVMVLFLHWSLSGAQRFDLEGGGVVVAAPGSDVTLPCSLTPRMSAVDMKVKWTRQDQGDKLVHHYKNKQDQTDDQDPSYRGRTSLFIEELQYGNTSLLLKYVQWSDGGQYTCGVQGTGVYKNITINLNVEGIGTNPQIIVEGTDVSGGIKLLCETTGWKSEPQLQWFSGGVELPAGDVENLQDNKRYTVRHRITTHNNGIFTCRVKQHPRMEKDISVILDNSGNQAAIGTDPVISVLGTDGSGGIRLLCETTGWNPEPELRVLDSNRAELSGGYNESHRAGVGFNVSLYVTAHGTPNVTCEMKRGQHKREKQMDITGIGSKPQIIVEVTDLSEGTRLLCETTGWKSKPQLQWFSGGKLLAGDVENLHDNGLYTVRHRITAHSGTNTFTCRVKQHPRMEKDIDISDHLSNGWKGVAICAIIVVLIIGAGVAVWCVWRHCRRQRGTPALESSQRDSVPTMSAVYKPAPTDTPGGAEETNGLNTPVTNDG
ncbi:butyrophilin-like protein 2 isoform X1 [Brachyhypopomus gauderio]|uniref:butyrophilin-like protein 2 isoform X1 n=1 Tax=Brachyhypopomus gauderio TaxID=698409 RepID=UPI004042C74B